MKSQPRYKPGDKIGGRYQVHQVKMGGMGEVYLCLDLEEMVPYALKTFRQRYLTNPKLHAAFENEVATWVAMEKHPNIVRCFYMDILDNQPFMILEWIAGEEGKGADLRGWLRRGPLDLRLALDFAIDICRGLIHAQEKQPGIVHRDLKPENILVAQGRLAKITDFGLAQIVQAAELEITEGVSEADGRQSLLGQGGIVGTPPYMAPEQWRGEVLDARTDIYAVGCILYEMLTGDWPFRATTLDGLRRQHLDADIPRLADRQTLPGSLNALLARCLAKRREERLASVGDLLQQLALIYEQQFAECPQAIPISGEFTAIDYNNRGVTYNALHRHKEALADLNRAIRLNVNYAIAYNNRGLAHADLERYNEALADYDRAIQLDPNFAQAYANRGNAYHNIRQYRKALADYGQAVQLDPNFAQAYANRGNSYADLHQYEEALAEYNWAIQLDSDDPKVYTNRGNTYDELCRYEEALADYNQAIRLDPNDATAYASRGLTYHNLCRYEAALVDYDRAIRLDPNNAKVYANRGIIYQELEKYDQALADCDQAIQLAPNCAPTYNNRGLVYNDLQQYDKALADYQRAIQLDPDYATAYFNIGALLGNEGEWRNALPYFEKAAQLGDPQGAQYAAQVIQMLKNARSEE
jgi:tetratricopeptide (TPR) repeat protein